MFYLSLCERDIFSIQSAHVSKKEEEQHCFCKLLEYLWYLKGLQRALRSFCCFWSELALEKHAWKKNKSMLSPQGLTDLKNDC